MSHLLKGFSLHAETTPVANNDVAATTKPNHEDSYYLNNCNVATHENASNVNNLQQYVTANNAIGYNNNNDYVNFNQFMMQHNFFGSSGGFHMGNNSAAGRTTFDPLLSATVPTAGQRNDCSYYNIDAGQNLDINNRDFDGAYGGNTEVLDSNGYYGLQQETQQAKNSYTNPFAYNNGSASASTGGCDASASFMSNQNIYTNLANTTNSGNNLYLENFAPFGNSNDSNYYTNPFATGFDLKSSKLQASAQEFVPRFDNLSLNDNQTDRIPANATPNGDIGTFSEVGISVSANLDYGTKQLKDNMQRVEEPQNMRMCEPAPNTDIENTVSTSSSSLNNATFNKTNNNNNHYHNNNNNNNNNNNKNISNGYNHAQSAGRSLNSLRNGGRRSADIYEREDRYERGDRFVTERYERGDRSDRGDRGDRSERGERNSRGNRQRYDNHRQNKRRDDWNRNRDRINGFRVDEKYGNDNGSSSPLTSPEKKPNSINGNSPKKQNAENEKLSQRDKLIRDIETRRLECLVCVEAIKSHQSVWSCRSCYHILHLQCIIKWASSSKSEDGWRCPACQNIEKEVPRDYYCFCGKVKNPPFNRQDTAHSCGEVCGRVEGCPHACTLLCHPGPCPPCQANVKRECGCGKTTQVMQCCLKKAIACDAICGKLLNCELHTCTAKCHESKCEACTEKVEQCCHCGKQERQVPCTRDSQDKHTYSCGKPCGKDLACGNHKCKDCCHAGECRPCKLSPEMVTSCPCGKMPVVKGQRTSCLDAIPTCDGVCNKTLRCGKASNPHHCTSKCHLGNCPPCNKQTAVKCRCGHMDQMIKCRLLSTRADDARCKKRCTKKRSCGKHKCNQECCIDIDHICPLPCNYTLSCGKHKCDQPCHRGNCPPCYRSSFEELYCECGAEVIYPPVPCGTKRPTCKKACSRAHPCDHPPQHTCHSASSCPPCMILTTKWCFGKHEQRKTIPCSQDSFSCGLSCNKPLPCGRHKCIKPCHEGPCQIAGEICKQSCTILRTTCGHKCMAPCHDGDCPDTPCKESVEVQCECGNRKQMRSCHDLVREFSRIATAQLASSMAEMQRGNYMELSEILQPVKVNKTNKTLDCNEECRLLERNRRLAIGLQVRNPDLQQKLLTKYSEFIRNFYKRDPTLVKSIHDALTTLVKLAKESKQKSRSHSFPTMNREKRQLVHEMCEMFGVDSVAYDKEPNRNVVATASKERSWLPATSIMEVVAREAGHRRVPVPSNNAWSLKR